MAGVAGGTLDSAGTLTWLTEDESGGPTAYSVSRIQESLANYVPITNRHAMLENEVRMLNGGTIRTAGAAPVCLLFDHGVNKFRDTIKPLLDARGLPATLELNGNMHKAGYNIESESNLVTWAEIDGWANVEIANHGAKHSTVSYKLEDLEEEVLGSLEDLKTNLPSKRILSWVQPAAYYPEYFNDGRSAEQYAGKVVGRMIYENHAIATGVWETPNHPLIPRDGRIMQGVTGQWIDLAGSTSTAQTDISAAATQGKGILIRNHPRVIATTNSVTTADITSFLDFLKTEQDAGASR